MLIFTLYNLRAEMKILFLDDSYRVDKNYLGNGGFCIDEEEISKLCEDILKLKRRFHIPSNVEIKWSPDQAHYLRTLSNEVRKKLYKDLLGLLKNYNVAVICSVHDLNECYGVKKHKWNMNRSLLWATKEQFKYIAERFERPVLESSDDYGIIIADKYSDNKGEIDLLKDMMDAITFGTDYRKFKRVCMNPLIAISDFCPPIQISDTIIGIIVGALAQSEYAKSYITDLVSLFLKNPNYGATTSSPILSTSILGFGLIMFPSGFRTKGIDLFRRLDKE